MSVDLVSSAFIFVCVTFFYDGTVSVTATAQRGKKRGERFGPLL